MTDTFFPTGPWNLGRWSNLSGAVAFGWWLIIVPALCFPAVKGKDLNPLTMNWTSLIYGGTMLIALFYYAVSARKWFKGPRINVEYVPDGAEVLEGRVPEERAATKEKQVEGKGLDM